MRPSRTSSVLRRIARAVRTARGPSRAAVGRALARVLAAVESGDPGDPGDPHAYLVLFHPGVELDGEVLDRVMDEHGAWTAESATRSETVVGVDPDRARAFVEALRDLRIPGLRKAYLYHSEDEVYAGTGDPAEFWDLS